MVLVAQSSAGHNAIIGRRVAHPSSTNYGDVPPPAKRLKTLESTDGDDSCDISEDEVSTRIPNQYRDEIPDSEEEVDDDLNDAQKSKPSRTTELESVLPPIKTDKEAIAEYDAMRASELDGLGDLEDRLKIRKWAKGKSSIYVDAFNLALETVLEDEGHLFDEKELEVFNQWRELDYEAQYL